MINNITIEICLGNIQDVEILNDYPIDRIELNSALELGGLTPSLNTLIQAKKVSNKKIVTMVRCRGGNFCYTPQEYAVMFEDAKNLLENNTDGIVFGFLNEDNSINFEKTKEMVDLAHSYHREAIFHKAFDDCKDMEEAIKQLIDLKVDRILTSGQAVYPDILLGCQKINNLYQKYSDKIQLLPGGGVRINNIIDVVKTANTKQVHMTSKRTNPNGYIELDVAQLEELLNKLHTMK